MYESLKEILLDLFKAPTAPPDPPAGAHDSIHVFRASPQYLSYQYLGFYVFMGILTLASLVVGAVVVSQEPALGLLVLVLLLVLCFLIAMMGYFVIRLEYDMRYYILTDRSLRIRKGVLQILEQTLTFVNIQNIKVEQGPIERLFGIAGVVVETAGGGSASNPETGSTGTNYHRAVMSGLENAETVRDLILNYLKRLPHTSGLGEPEEQRRRRESSHAAGFTPAETEALKEILQEMKQLRQAL